MHVDKDFKGISKPTLHWKCITYKARTELNKHQKQHTVMMCLKLTLKTINMTDLPQFDLSVLHK